MENDRIAILIPCYNEEQTIGSVIEGFREYLADAEIYVYDNNSTDKTMQYAKDAGAIVRMECLQGKGNVIRRMFSDVDSDIYIIVDGDDTYDPSAVVVAITELQSNGLDMVNCSRYSNEDDAYRTGHRLGNKLLTGMVAFVFGNRIHDMLSGYRVFSRRFVKSFPALSTGFEIETELTVHALELRMPISEVVTYYKERPAGSESKLNTYKDGFRILGTIIKLIKNEKPLQLFGMLGMLMIFLSLILSFPLIKTYLETGMVPRFPTAILATGMMILAFLSISIGLILDSVSLGRKEAKRLRYLSERAIGSK